MLKDNEAYRSLFDCNPDGVLLLDLPGRCLALNAAAEKLTGLTLGEIRNCNFRDLCLPDERDKIGQALAVAAERSSAELETTMLGKDGSRLHLALTVGPIVMHGTVEGLFICLRNPAARKEVETGLQRELDQLKSQARQVMTELQNEAARQAVLRQQLQQLAAALSMAEHRERKKLAKILHDELQQILVAAKFQLAGITHAPVDEIRSLIDQAISTTRSLTAELSPSVLNRGLVPALEWLSRWMKQKLGFSVSLSAADIPQTNEATTVLLYQAVRELLFNASKHARVEAARVHVSLVEDHLHISVQDDGVGFDPKSLHKDDLEGFGLVSIGERIALLGGRFDIESAPGAGSRFVICVPLCKD